MDTKTDDRAIDQEHDRTMNLEQRIRDISKAHGLSHIGSCISVLPILTQIYETKGKNDVVIMDNAHAHLAHLVVREAYEGLKDIEKLLTDHGIHCDRKAGCDVSGGSLGHGLGIAIGLAIADEKRKIHVIISDGSIMEGSNWEAMRVISDRKIENIQIYCNFNGYTATSIYDANRLSSRMRAFIPNILVYNTENGKGLDGIQGHYKTL